MLTQRQMDQAAVIASRDAEAQYLFARDVPNADMPALFAAVMTGGDTKWIFEFVFKLPAASIVAAVQFAAIETGRGMNQYHAAMYEGADISVLQSAVIESGDDHAHYLFARHIEGADFEALTDAMNSSADRIAQLEFCDIRSCTIRASSMTASHPVNRLEMVMAKKEFSCRWKHQFTDAPDVHFDCIADSGCYTYKEI